MSQFQAKRVAFIGLGLISGSLARALRASGWQGRLIAWGPREPSLKRGLELDIIDAYSLELADIIAEADVIVIGAPPIATGDILRQLGEYLADSNHQPIITDLASIKGFVVDAMGRDYPNFVPGHPIAGSEHSGVDFADAALFEGREVILTPLPETSPTAVAQVQAMWALAGAYLRTMTVEDHDRMLAASSHMPHVVAYALTRALERDSGDPMVHGGGALRDMTRIASSDPLMWADIAVTNRAALLQAVDSFETEMAELRALIASGDANTMRDYFAVCRAHRRAHDNILNPMLQPSTEEP